MATWWREHRPAAPTLFEEELAQATENLSNLPCAGSIYRSVDGTIVRRLLLPKTEQHVYYVVHEEKGVIVILTVWGARRGRGPSL